MRLSTLRGLLALAAAGVVTLLPALPARATPATLGFYPATDVYGKGAWHLDVDTYGRAAKMDSSVTSGLTYGVGPDKDGAFGRSEIGFDYAISLLGVTPTVSTENRLLFNAKTQLYNNDTKGERIVVGVWGVGSKNLFAPDYGYISGSKAFPFGRITVGVAHSFAPDVAGVAAITTPAGNAQKTSLHLGYDRSLSKKFSFAADWYSGKSALACAQPTLYYLPNDKSDFGLGFAFFNDKSVAPSPHQTYICYDYNF